MKICFFFCAEEKLCSSSVPLTGPCVNGKDEELKKVPHHTIDNETYLFYEVETVGR